MFLCRLQCSLLFCQYLKSRYFIKKIIFIFVLLSPWRELTTGTTCWSWDFMALCSFGSLWMSRGRWGCYTTGCVQPRRHVAKCLFKQKRLCIERPVLLRKRCIESSWFTACTALLDTPEFIYRLLMTELRVSHTRPQSALPDFFLSHTADALYRS